MKSSAGVTCWLLLYAGGNPVPVNSQDQLSAPEPPPAPQCRRLAAGLRFAAAHERHRTVPSARAEVISCRLGIS